MAKKHQPNPNEIIEVVAIKKLSRKEYIATKPKLEQEGWKAQGYQVGFYGNDLKQKCE
jgi:hypothetical protein